MMLASMGLARNRTFKNDNRSIPPIKKGGRDGTHGESTIYRFWHQGIVNNNIDSSVNMEAVSRTLSRLVLIKDNKSSN